MNHKYNRHKVYKNFHLEKLTNQTEILLRKLLVFRSTYVLCMYLLVNRIQYEHTYILSQSNKSSQASKQDWVVQSIPVSILPITACRLILTQFSQTFILFLASIVINWKIIWCAPKLTKCITCFLCIVFFTDIGKYLRITLMWWYFSCVFSFIGDWEL